jgi:hypothetical protein
MIPPSGAGLSRLEIAAGIAALGWLALGVLRLWLMPTGLGPGGVVAEVVGSVLPVILLAALVAAQRRITALEAELAAARRTARVADKGGAGATGVVPLTQAPPRAVTAPVAGRPSSPPRTAGPQGRAAHTGPAQAAGYGMASRIAVVQPTAEAPQSEFNLAAPDATPPAPLTRADALSALDFPSSPKDAVGRTALIKGLADPWFARILRSGQDVLVLLAQDGLFAETLPAAQGDPALWLRFVAGERGAGLADLCPADPDLSDALATRLRQDEVFRDAAHHFLRRFDEFLAAFAKDADAAEIATLAQTRSARAFAILAKSVGALG